MKRQEIWDWAIEAYDPPDVLTAFKMRRAVEHLKGLDVAPKLKHPPIMVHPDAWKALQEMDEEMEKASGATDFNIDEFVTEEEMTISEAKAKWPNLGADI